MRFTCAEKNIRAELWERERTIFSNHTKTVVHLQHTQQWGHVEGRLNKSFCLHAEYYISPQSRTLGDTQKEGRQPLKQMIFFFSSNTAETQQVKKWSKTSWKKDFIFHHPICTFVFQGSINSLLPLSLAFWCLCQLLFSLRMHYDLEMSQPELQRQWKYFEETLYKNWQPKLAGCALTAKEMFYTSVPHLKARVTKLLVFTGLLRGIYKKDHISDNCWHIALFFSQHICFIMPKLFKATLGNIWPLRAWKTYNNKALK